MMSARRLSRLLLVLTLCVGMQGTVLVEALFLIHQDHIAEHHCVNRNNPEIDCDGMCFLVKRIEDVHDQHDHNSLTMRVPDIDLRAVSMLAALSPWVLLREHDYPPAQNLAVPDPPPVDIFRPPWSA